MPKSLWRLFLLATLLSADPTQALAQANASARDSVVSKEPPLWQVDLHSFGYPRERRYYTTLPDARPLNLDFIDKDVLAWAWVTLDAPPAPGHGKKQPHQPLPPQAAHLHVLSLDSRTGQKTALQQWAVPSFPLHFSAAASGKSILCTDNMLRLFSPSSEVLREQTLPAPMKCPDTPPTTPTAVGGWTVSPDRKYLLLWNFQGLDQMWNLETLDLQASWERGKDWFQESIADHHIVASCGKPVKICIGRTDQPAATVSTASGKRASFVSDDVFVITDNRSMAAVDLNGPVLFERMTSKNETFGRLVPSSQTDRFAVMVLRKRGVENDTLDFYPFDADDRIAVYTVSGRRAIFVVEVKGTSPWTPWHPHINRFALSPDGKLLAVEDDGALKVYQLPAPDLQHEKPS